MREIVLDTETTGLNPAEDRIVEIGAVELINHLPTGRDYHVYINPARPMSADAQRIHGLDDAFLADKPRFEEIAEGFLGFLGDARLVIHNAAFDMGMINAELQRLGLSRIPDDRALDTVGIARRRFPGAQASLDALCKRFGIDNSARTKHGALLDSELLADVYLELLGGRQQGFSLDAAETASSDASSPSHDTSIVTRTRGRAKPLPPRVTPEERALHEAFVATLGDEPLWRRFG